MKQKLLALLALVMTAMTASAVVEPTYPLTPKESGGEGTITFKVDNNVVTKAPEGATVTLTVAAPDGFSVGSVTGQWSAAVAATRGSSAQEVAMLKDIAFTSDGENTWTFTMERAEAVISIKYAKIIQDSWIQNIAAVTYNGSAQKPSVVVKDGETVLEEGVDYTVSYSNNTNAGTATVTVTGIGNYSGTASKTFTINKARGSVSFSPDKFTKTYGDPDFTITPSVIGYGSLMYSSNDNSIATVNSLTGKVSIKGIGTVRITASMPNSKNYTSASDWYEVTIIQKQTSVTIGAKGIATYCGTEPLDFTGNEELAAYTVIGCSYGSNTIWLSRVYDVPAETPILIKGAEGSYTLDCATASDSYFKNKLVGNLSGSSLRIEETDGALRNYYLKEGTFKRVNGYANIGNGKSYLQLPDVPADEKAGSAAVSITLSSTGKSTLCSDVDLDFSGVDGLTAYVVTGYDKSIKTFWMNRVIEASAGTPLYLVGSASTAYSIPTKGVQTDFENMLVGNLSGSSIRVEESAEGGDGEALRNLYLKDGTFKLVKGYANIGNGKCYLQAPSAVVAAMARGMEDSDFSFILSDELMSMSFSDFDDEATGIMSVEKANATSDAIYDLQGRRVAAPRKGIYIKGGRKVVLK